MELFLEAKRRRVFRTAGVYLVGVWAVSQGIVELAPLFDIPAWLLRAVLIGAVALAPLVVILAWMFDIGRSGIVRDAQDVENANRDEDLSKMQTQIGSNAEQGALAVNWTDAEGVHRIVFIDEFFIGRANDCRVRFYDPLVSRKHARVFNADETWQLQDLGSRNGTLVDGQRIDSLVLDASCEVRVNEAGPVLGFELIAPGEETRVALSESSERSAVAHIRVQTK
jgi:FHA domain